MDGRKVALLCILQITIATATSYRENAIFQSTSRGADCNCRCILQSNQGAFCPGSTTKRRTVYTMRSDPSGDDCKCICTAPPPGGCEENEIIVQQPNQQNSQLIANRFSELVSALVSIERIISRKTEDGIMLKKAIANLVKLEQELSSDNSQSEEKSTKIKPIPPEPRVTKIPDMEADGQGSGENTAFLDDEEGDVIIDEMPTIGKPAPLVASRSHTTKPHFVIQLPNKIPHSQSAISSGRVFTSGGEYYFKTRFHTSSRVSVVKPMLMQVAPQKPTLLPPASKFNVGNTPTTTTTTTTPTTTTTTTTPTTTIPTTTTPRTTSTSTTMISTTTTPRTTSTSTTTPTTTSSTTTTPRTTSSTTTIPTTTSSTTTTTSTTTSPTTTTPTTTSSTTTKPTTTSSTTRIPTTRTTSSTTVVTTTSSTTEDSPPVHESYKDEDDLYYYEEYYNEESPVETTIATATATTRKTEVIVPRLTAVLNELYRNKKFDDSEPSFDVENFEEVQRIRPSEAREDAEHSVSFHNTNQITGKMDRHAVDKKEDPKVDYEDFYDNDYYNGVYYYENDEAEEVSTTPKTTTTTTERTTTITPANGICGTLSFLSPPTTIYHFGRREGAWMKDAVASSTDPARNDKIYYANFYYGNNLLEFENLQMLKQMRWSNSYILPSRWIGTGHVVYNGSLYYNQAFTKSLVKYDLKYRFISAWKHLKDATYDSNAPYSWRGHSMVHATADEEGLWVLYPSDDPRDPWAPIRYVIHKIDPVDLRTIQSFRSDIRSSASHIFMVCGVVYSTDRYNTKAGRITRAFDTHTQRSTSLYQPFQNKYSYTVQMLYNPRDRKVYAWDNGRQLRYDVNMTF